LPLNLPHPALSGAGDEIDRVQAGWWQLSALCEPNASWPWLPKVEDRLATRANS